MTNFTDKYVNINGINTRFWQAGNKGTPILLIHGFVESVEYWQENIAALAKNHRVYALDLIGFGHTDKPKKINYTEKLFVKFVKDFMASQNLTKVNLIGHSLGGAVALHFTIAYPELVDKLVLVSSAGLGRELPAHFRILTLPIIGNIVFRVKLKKLLGLALRSHTYNPDAISDELLQSIHKIFLLPNFSKTMVKILQKYANCNGIRRRAIKPILKNLKNITAPTLIIWGKQDHLLLVKHAYVALRHLPNAKLEVLDECGHFPQLEQSKKFNKLVLKFLC